MRPALARSDRRFSAAIGAVVLTGSLIGIACYPGSVSNVAELDTVVTFHFDDTTFYQKFSTYILNDTVIEFAPGDSVCGPGIVIPGNCVDPQYDHSKDALILATYRAEIEKAGFVPATGADTSAVFAVGVTARSDTSIWVSWPIWPGWGPGWGCCGWGPGWGWGWGWPPTGGVQVTDQGSLVMLMLDPDGPPAPAPADSIIQGAWAGLVNAVLSSSGVSDARVQNGIVQAWAQSPYLKR